MWNEQTPLPFIKTYLDRLNQGLELEGKQYKLSITQKLWLGFCLMGILMTNSICWAKFERMSFKSYTQHALSWMFRHAKLPWEKLLLTSTKTILNAFQIKEGVLVIDDKDEPIHKVPLDVIVCILTTKSGGTMAGRFDGLE